MKLLVLGATGGTGLQILDRAIAEGHEVTAMVRSPEKLARYGSKIKVVTGDLLNASELAEAMRGQDAVLSGFGRTPGSEGDLLTRFDRALVEAMKMSGVHRLVYVSMAFLFRSLLTTVVGNLFFRDLVRDAAEGEAFIRQSSLDWTIARPPRLTDGPGGEYRVREGALPFFGFKISRESVADFVVKESASGVHTGQVVGLAT